MNYRSILNAECPWIAITINMYSSYQLEDNSSATCVQGCSKMSQDVFRHLEDAQQH